MFMEKYKLKDITDELLELYIGHEFIINEPYYRIRGRIKGISKHQIGIENFIYLAPGKHHLDHFHITRFCNHLVWFDYKNLKKVKPNHSQIIIL